MHAGQLYEIKAKVKLPRDGREIWVKIGSAKSFDKGDGRAGISCSITSIPLNWDGSFCMWPPQGRDSAAPSTPPSAPPPAADDDIPF